MKIDLYADFETTKVIYDTNKYGAFGEAYKNQKDIEQFPKVYAGMCSYEKSNQRYSDIFNLNNIDRDNYRYLERNNNLYFYGNNIYSFVDYISNISQEVNIWFHNGAKFDFHFLFRALLEKGYQYIPLFKDKDNVNSPYLKERMEILQQTTNKITQKEGEILLPYEFNGIIDGSKKIYTLMLNNNQKHYNGLETKNLTIVIKFRDSNLLFPGTLEQYGKKLNQIFNTNEFTKKSISYERTTLYKTLEEMEQDTLEFEYLIQDVKILATFLKEMGKRQELPRHKGKLTSASTAYSQGEIDYATKFFNNHIKKKKNVRVNEKSGYKTYKSLYSNKFVKEGDWKKILVRKRFPTKGLDQCLDGQYIGVLLHSKYYKGGMTMVNENVRGKFLESVNGFDINSSYPSVMNSDNIAPIGLPIYNIRKIDYDYYQLLRLKIKEPIENKYGIPFFVNQNNNQKTKQYLKYLEPDMETFIDTFEYQRFLKYYSNDNSKFEVDVLVSFFTVKMKDIFGTFIDKGYDIKSNSQDTLTRDISKLMLNSTYGKFGTKLVRESKVGDHSKNDGLDIVRTEKAKFYLPLAIAITSLARCKIIDSVDTNYNDFYYCDTDSIYLNANNNFIKNVSNKLGDWKLENKFPLKGVFRRPKQYLLRNGIDKDKLVYAGINFSKLDLDGVETIHFKDFVFGIEIPNQLRSYKLEGLVIIDGIQKKVQPIGTYPCNKEQIYQRKKDYELLGKDFELNKDIKFSRVREKTTKKQLTLISYKS